MMSKKIDTNKLIQDFRQKIEADYREYSSKGIFEIITEHMFNYIDDFIKNPEKSNLEKIFFLFLNQYPSDHKNYIVVPSENVLVRDYYDMKVPAIEYEIDFAIYGGREDNPVKIAIECDGLRSHRQKYNHKDRRKNINLQAAGWIVIRFGSKEIIEEVQSLLDDNLESKYFLISIENLIKNTTKVIGGTNYFLNNEIKGNLTGYKYADINCKLCGQKTKAILNHRRVRCNRCGEKFEREIGDDEKIKYEHNGIFIFKD